MQRDREVSEGPRVRTRRTPGPCLRRLSCPPPPSCLPPPLISDQVGGKRIPFYPANPRLGSAAKEGNGDCGGVDGIGGVGGKGDEWEEEKGA